jgi:hypothetical protein
MTSRPSRTHRVDISGSETSKQYIVEATGNGVAIFDFDNDGLPDIFLVNSGTLGTGAVHPKHFLYHNLGGLKFEDVTSKAGIKPTGWGQGVCVGFVDNRSYPDLFITQWGQNVLYRNLGNAHSRTRRRSGGCFRQNRVGVQAVRSSISTETDFWIWSSSTMWTST